MITYILEYESLFVCLFVCPSVFYQHIDKSEFKLVAKQSEMPQFQDASTVKALIWAFEVDGVILCYSFIYCVFFKHLFRPENKLDDSI